MRLRDKRYLAVLVVLALGVVVMLRASQMLASFAGHAWIRNIPPKAIVLLVTENGEDTDQMYPYTIYSIIIQVLDLNGYRDIQKVDLILQHSSYTGDVSEADKYIFVWERDKGAYEVGMSGHLLECSVKRINRILMKLNFTIALGLARMGEWKITAIPYDEEEGYPKARYVDMMFYAELSLYTMEIYFYGYPNETVSADRIVNGTITANGPFHLLTKATNLTSNETDFEIAVFYLKVNVINDTETAKNMSYDYIAIDYYSGDYAKDLYFELYYFLEIPIGTPDALYHGTIYLAIENLEV